MENNNSIIKNNLFIILSIFFIIILSFLGYMLPYLLNEYKFAIGFDSGVNLYKIITNEKNFWDDPMFYTFFSVLNNISGMNISNNYITLPIFLLLPLFLILYLISFSLTKNIKYSILSVFIVGTSIIFIKGFYESYYKQIFASILSLYLAYFISKYNNKNFLYILGPIIFSAIFISHKAIAFMSFIIILLILFSKRKNTRNYIKSITFFFLISFLITLPYTFNLIPDYSKTLYESIQLTLKGVSSVSTVPGDVVGRSLISDTNSINPFFDIIFFIPFLYLIGIFCFFLINKENKKNNKGIIFSIIFLILWTLSKGNFSNRFIWNLNLFLLILIPLFLKLINSKKVRILFIFTIILFSSINYIEYTQTRKPYIVDNLEGVNFIENNIQKINTIIIAPDYIQSSLAQKGYLVSQYYPEIDINLSTGKTVDKLGMIQSDDFLILGHSDISFLYNYNLTKYEVYVVFGEWDTNTKLPRTTLNGKISLIAWDNSKYFDKIYNGKSEILRVYKLKEQYKLQNEN